MKSSVVVLPTTTTVVRGDVSSRLLVTMEKSYIRDKFILRRHKDPGWCARCELFINNYLFTYYIIVPYTSDDSDINLGLKVMNDRHTRVKLVFILRLLRKELLSEYLYFLKCVLTRLYL